ncbi:unnamed protein product [Linum trigynum]|uniref:Uncharacterized protein n=1 Tax=Linum trigynum TaxID=586398 RepID=A0AAV2DTI1_9ROSI
MFRCGSRLGNRKEEEHMDIEVLYCRMSSDLLQEKRSQTLADIATNTLLIVCISCFVINQMVPSFKTTVNIGVVKHVTSRTNDL